MSAIRTATLTEVEYRSSGVSIEITIPLSIEKTPTIFRNILQEFSEERISTLDYHYYGWVHVCYFFCQVCLSWSPIFLNTTKQHATRTCTHCGIQHNIAHSQFVMPEEYFALVRSYTGEGNFHPCPISLFEIPEGATIPKPTQQAPPRGDIFSLRRTDDNVDLSSLVERINASALSLKRHFPRSAAKAVEKARLYMEQCKPVEHRHVVVHCYSCGSSFVSSYEVSGETGSKGQVIIPESCICPYCLVDIARVCSSQWRDHIPTSFGAYVTNNRAKLRTSAYFKFINTLFGTQYNHPLVDGFISAEGSIPAVLPGRYNKKWKSSLVR